MLIRRLCLVEEEDSDQEEVEVVERRGSVSSEEEEARFLVCSVEDYRAEPRLCASGT